MSVSDFIHLLVQSYRYQRWTDLQFINSLLLDKIFDEQLIVYERDRGTHIEREIVSERETNTQREGGRKAFRERENFRSTLYCAPCPSLILIN